MAVTPRVAAPKRVAASARYAPAYRGLIACIRSRPFRPEEVSPVKGAVVKLADRMLARILPEFSAAGCCPPDYHQICILYRGPCYPRAQEFNCYYDCNCNEHCQMQNYCC